MLDKLKAIALGGVLGTLVSVPLFSYWGLYDTEPYSKVRVVEVTREQGDIRYQATFMKNTCEFKALTVVGTQFGIPERIKWADFDGEEKGDRERGLQHLNLVLFTEDKQYDTIEIRTRHVCPTEEGEINVDAIFDTIHPKNLQEGAICVPSHLARLFSRGQGC